MAQLAKQVSQTMCRCTAITDDVQMHGYHRRCADARLSQRRRCMITGDAQIRDPVHATLTLALSLKLTLALSLEYTLALSLEYTLALSLEYNAGAVAGVQRWRCRVARSRQVCIYLMEALLIQ